MPLQVKGSRLAVPLHQRAPVEIEGSEADERLREMPTKSAHRSIWAPRAAWCDSRALYDNEETRAAIFEHDWVRSTCRWSSVMTSDGLRRPLTPTR